MYMYVNKGVELVQLGIALEKMYVCIIIIFIIMSAFLPLPVIYAIVVREILKTFLCVDF